jgi:acyl carrier protein
MNQNLQRVIEIICTVGRVADLQPDQDFYEAGVSSIASLSLLMELETSFDVSIPDDKFVTARSASSMSDLISRLQAENAVGETFHG